jgi:hypothetical protein
MEDKEEEEQFSALPAFSACFEQEEIQTKPLRTRTPIYCK